MRSFRPPPNPGRCLALAAIVSLTLPLAARTSAQAPVPPESSPDTTSAGPPGDAAPDEPLDAAIAAPAPEPLVAVAPELLPPAPPSEPTEEAPRSAPTRIRPITIRTDDGEVSLGFASQLRVTTTNDGARLGQGGARSTETSVELRRVRLFVRGKFFHDRLAFLFQLSTSPSSLELLDLSLDAGIREHLRLRVGQFKTPFTLHRFRSFANLPMQEWDLAAVRFGAERQIGAEIRTDAHGLDVVFGAFAGPGARAAFARGIAETYQETLPNPSNLRAAQPPTQFHPELIARVGYGSEGVDPLILSDPSGGGLRYYVALSGAYDFAPVETFDFAARVAAETVLKVEHVTLNAVGYLGFDDSATHGIELGMVGATLDVTVRLHERFEIAARYSRVDTLGRFRQTARDYVDRIVAAADPADAPAIDQAHASAGRTRHQEEYALGVNVPIIGRNLVYQTDVALVRTDRVGTNDADQIRWRSQLQFMF